MVGDEEIMCNYCEPNGWRRKSCCICGVGSEVYISISIATGEDEEFPYTQTDLCKKCWDEHGVRCAIEHNKECME